MKTAPIKFIDTWNGIVSAVFAISFTGMSSSAAGSTRDRVMSFAYMPVNVGFIGRPAIGVWVTAGRVFNVFPAAVFNLLGLAALGLAYRQSE